MSKSKAFLSKFYSKISEDSCYNKAMLHDFFDELFEDGFDEKLWPYDYSKSNLRLSKFKIVQDSNNGKFQKDFFRFNFEYKNEDDKDALDLSMIWYRKKDNSINFRLHSVKKTGNLPIKNFAWKLVQKHKDLLDVIGDDKSKNRLLLNAYSCMSDSGAIGEYRGSVVWASRGFDFGDFDFNLKDMQDDFALFLRKRKIYLSKTQKEKFTKPYHFSNFRTDLKEKAVIVDDDNNIKEKNISLGKLFLLKEYSLWPAVLKGGKDNQSTYNFAKNYNRSYSSRQVSLNKMNSELGVNNLKPQTQIYHLYHNVRSKMLG